MPVREFVRRSARVLTGVLTASSLAAAPGVVPVAAQPAPSFHATCSGLRAALKTLDMRGDPLITIEVEGTLTHVQEGEALTYMVLCSPPDPQVLCVTYRSNGRKVGDKVVVTGAYIPRGPDHVQLDPCLHHLPGEPGD